MAATSGAGRDIGQNPHDGDPLPRRLAPFDLDEAEDESRLGVLHPRLVHPPGRDHPVVDPVTERGQPDATVVAYDGRRPPGPNAREEPFGAERAVRDNHVSGLECR
ncbi:hypothetical protein [Fimbriiglobus ruber]|uniref:hypothetical protein n=1 Tax=Fimbriiglobus ruber TaxID=1908690 RepID=UPI000B4BF5CA|nr:hypothetical protein [Fimbriiglobus ruber]